MTLLFDTRYLFVRSLKKLFRNPILLFFSLLQPIIFLLLFTQLFSRFASIPGFGTSTCDTANPTYAFPNYVSFAIAGIVLQNAFSSAFQSGTAVVDDVKSGYLEKMLATPDSRPAILLGRLLTDSFRVVVQSSIILGLGVLAFGVFPATGPLGLLLILVTIAFFGLAWAGISLALGLKTKSAESVFGIAGFLTFPLLFMSTALSPQFFLPDWMKSVSAYNPVSITVDAIRALVIGPGWTNVWNPLITAYAVIALIAVVTLGATMYLFRKVIG